MKEKSISQIPVLDEPGKILEIILLKELIEVRSFGKSCFNYGGRHWFKIKTFYRKLSKTYAKNGDKPILEI